MSNDASKLPQWAQKHITRLEQDVEYWKAKALATTTEGESNTRIRELMEFRALPPNCVVRFGDDRQWIEVHCAEKHTVEIHAAMRLRIQPGAANAITMWSTP